MPERTARPIALVTGGSKGIGLALAGEFARHGHDLILVARDEAALERAAWDLRQTTQAVVYLYAGDLSREETPEQLLRWVSDTGLQCNSYVTAGSSERGMERGLRTRLLCRFSDSLPRRGSSRDWPAAGRWFYELLPTALPPYRLTARLPDCPPHWTPCNGRDNRRSPRCRCGSLLSSGPASTRGGLPGPRALRTQRNHPPA